MSLERVGSTPLDYQKKIDDLEESYKQVQKEEMIAASACAMVLLTIVGLSIALGADSDFAVKAESSMNEIEAGLVLMGSCSVAWKLFQCASNRQVACDCISSRINDLKGLQKSTWRPKNDEKGSSASSIRPFEIGSDQIPSLT